MQNPEYSLGSRGNPGFVTLISHCPAYVAHAGPNSRGIKSQSLNNQQWSSSGFVHGKVTTCTCTLHDHTEVLFNQIAFGLGQTFICFTSCLVASVSVDSCWLSEEGKLQMTQSGHTAINPMP